MDNREKMRRFNRSLDDLLQGGAPDEDDPALELARRLAQLDLSGGSRRRNELRCRFQMRRSRPALPPPGPWRLAHNAYLTSTLAGLLLVAIISSVFVIAALPGAGVRPMPQGEAVTSASTIAGPDPLGLVMHSPQPIPTPYAPRKVASPAPLPQEPARTTLELSPTQIYTRQPTQPAPRLLDNKP